MQVIKRISLLIILTVIVQNTLLSQGILSNRTYPYITVDNKDSIIFVFSPAQYDQIVKLIKEEEVQNFQLSLSDSIIYSQDNLLGSYSQEVLNYKQLIIDHEQKYLSLNDLFRINQRNYSEVVSKNLDLTNQLRDATNKKNKWRGYTMALTVVGIAAALISLN